MVALDGEGNLRAISITLKQFPVANYNFQCRCGRSGEVEKFCNMRLNEVMGTIPINKDHNPVVRDLVVDAEGFRRRQFGQSVKTYLGLVIGVLFEQGYDRRVHE